eukprot:s118_g21.t1
MIVLPQNHGGARFDSWQPQGGCCPNILAFKKQLTTVVMTATRPASRGAPHVARGKRSRQSLRGMASASTAMLGTATLRCFVGQVPRPAPAPCSAPCHASRLPLNGVWHHGVVRHGATLWQRVAALQWPWQKSKPEPHLLQPLHDFVNGVWWQLELLWKATGLEPWLGLFWSALSPYPPFNWLQWAALKVWHLPRLYRFYIIYVFADNVWKWLLPSLHEEVMSGIFLALLHRYNPKGYVDRVVNRFVSLLNKQAKLLSPKGVRAPLPEELVFSRHVGPHGPWVFKVSYACSGSWLRIDVFETQKPWAQGENWTLAG